MQIVLQCAMALLTKHRTLEFNKFFCVLDLNRSPTTGYQLKGELCDRLVHKLQFFYPFFFG